MARPNSQHCPRGGRAGQLKGLNALLLLLLCAYLGRDSYFGLISALPVFLVLFCGSSVYHLIPERLERRGLLAPALRIPLYLLPALTVAGGLLILFQLPQPPNHRTPAVSPSGNYVLTMPIEQGLWRVTIRDRQGKLLFRDDSEFAGQLNVYWIWDQQDRVWMMNSDDSVVYFWEQTPRGWQRHHWGPGRKRELPREITPPPGLYPGYS